MVIRVIPPDEAKKQARERVEKWRREKAIKTAKGGIGSEEPANEDIARRSGALPWQEQNALNVKLHESAKEGDMKRVAELLQKGAYVDGVVHHSCYTALMRASEYGLKETVELLLEKGANVEACCSHNYTALILASSNGHMGTVELLLNNGADVDAKDELGWTALMWASTMGHTETVELLKRYGAEE